MLTNVPFQSGLTLNLFASFEVELDLSKVRILDGSKWNGILEEVGQLSDLGSVGLRSQLSLMKKFK